ncbi:acyl-CoA dehydrogenase family protein, partial [Aeromicrobium sp. CnD17-E]|uniref:acyl-CoA dehydrogenase family protein n=1 Tax=Aeromicrobium sp. CnD17-E TaxID=2954487 RepID=UPI00209745C7
MRGGERVARDPLVRGCGRSARVAAAHCRVQGDDQLSQSGAPALRAGEDEKIIPVAQQLEHDDEYPTEIIEGLKELGVFGLTIPEEFGGL